MGGERDFAPKMNPGRATPGASPEATLLEVVAGLMRESRPAAGELPVPRLDSLLDRDLGIDSLARVELLLRIGAPSTCAFPSTSSAPRETPRDLLRAMLAGTPRGNGGDGRRRGSRAGRRRGGRAARGHATLIEALDWHVARHPERVHVTFVGEGDGGEQDHLRQLRPSAGRGRRTPRRGVARARRWRSCCPPGATSSRFLGVLLAGARPGADLPAVRAEPARGAPAAPGAAS